MLTIKDALKAVIEVFKQQRDASDLPTEQAVYSLVIEELRATRDWITDDVEIKKDADGRITLGDLA